MKPHELPSHDASRMRLDSCQAPPASSRLDLPESLPHPADVARRVSEGLLFLWQANQYAGDVVADPWDFAIELRELRSLGLTKSDLRWLVLKGYVEHARETTLPGEETRSFRQTRGLTFTKRTCFVITTSGIEAAQTLNVRDRLPVHSGESIGSAPSKKPPQRVMPRWDADLQELRVNGLVVKQFKVPAPNQEMVLSAFDEEGWPPRIDDPLPPAADQDPKRRLHDTIISLNRSHKHRLIRFMGDGSGEGVRWTLVEDDGATTAREE